jgi:hypothetical protein
MINKLSVASNIVLTFLQNLQRNGWDNKSIVNQESDYCLIIIESSGQGDNYDGSYKSNEQQEDRLKIKYRRIK